MIGGWPNTVGNTSCNNLLCHESYLAYLMLSHFILHLVATVATWYHDFVFGKLSMLLAHRGGISHRETASVLNRAVHPS